MIFFVGDQPSAKNIDPEIPFVGTQSYKRLLDWIWQLNLSTVDVVICNKHQIHQYSYIDQFYVQLPNFQSDIMCGDAVVALGNQASKKLTKMGVEHFLLPHPSGLNRKLNNKKYVKKILGDCKKWIETR